VNISIIKIQLHNRDGAVRDPRSSSIRLSPIIGQCPEDELAKDQWTFANGKLPATSLLLLAS